MGSGTRLGALLSALNIQDDRRGGTDRTPSSLPRHHNRSTLHNSSAWPSYVVSHHALAGAHSAWQLSDFVSQLVEGKSQQ